MIMACQFALEPGIPGLIDGSSSSSLYKPGLQRVFVASVSIKLNCDKMMNCNVTHKLHLIANKIRAQLNLIGCQIINFSVILFVQEKFWCLPQMSKIDLVPWCFKVNITLAATAVYIIAHKMISDTLRI